MSTRLEATAQERKEDLAERKGSPGELHSMGEGVGEGVGVGGGGCIKRG